MRLVPLKSGFVISLFGMAMVAGLYLAGWLTLELLELSVPLKLTTYYDYWNALALPQVAPYVTKIKAAGAIGFGVPLLGWLLLLIPLFRTRDKKSTHGDARFATRSDLAKSGLLKEDSTGIIVGKIDGQFLRLPGTRHALAAAPTRSGKGVGLVMPNLLNFQGSLVLLDIKQEGFDFTSGYRATLGPTHLFNPFAEDLKSARWNPFFYVRTEPLHRTGDLQAIASCLYKEAPGQDPFWSRMSSSAFVAAASYLFDFWAERVSRIGPEAATAMHYPTLGKVYRLLCGDGDAELKAGLQERMADPFVSADTRMGLASLTGLAEETFTSVIATTQAPLLIVANPIVDAVTSGNTFDLRSLRRQVQTVYVGISPSKLGEANTLLNLFFEQAIKLNAAVLPEQGSTLKHQCLFLLDEFTALGRVDILVEGVAWLAGYNVRIFCVIQSLSQLEAVYGPEKARAMVTNLACQVIYTPREQRDANEYSEMLGYTTMHKRNRTRSHGQGSSTSYAEVEERRALMLPQELKALSPDKEIVFIEGAAHPVMADKIRYYSDPFFKKRMNWPKAAVPALPLGGAADMDTQSVPAPAARVTEDEAEPVRWRKPYVGMVENGKVLSALPMLDQAGCGQNPPTEQGTLITVGRPKIIDPLHELKLLHMLQVANERTVRELGPMPAGGLPAQVKRKPDVPYRTFNGEVLAKAPAPSDEHEENDEMSKWNQLAASAALTAGALSACAQTTPQLEAKHNSKEFSGEWSVKWCDKTNPAADCGGFNVYLVQEGGRVCGNYFGARGGLAQVDEGVGRTISGIASEGEAELTIESSRNNAVYLVHASAQGDVMTWNVIKTIKESNSDIDLIAYDDRLWRNPNISEQYMQVMGECALGSSQ